MSATNSTNTIGLSQYISTDKPTYLVDYNGDMLKIDNAIAEDRDSIGDVNTIATRADGKADTNKLSIDTLNEQINGDPTDPEDTGIAGKVTALEGNVNSINSLIGNGSPTTSDQTIIGAINGLEGAVAPREDSADLANSYASGEQFARGGSIYETLTSLTAGTAFASLTLNTDYKVADTLVEQIGDCRDGVNGSTVIKILDNDIEIVADGVKTYDTLITELHTAAVALLASLSDSEAVTFNIVQISGKGDYINETLTVPFKNTASSIYCAFERVLTGASALTFARLYLTPAGSSVRAFTECSIDSTPAVAFTDLKSVVPTSGDKILLRYSVYDTISI